MLDRQVGAHEVLDPGPAGAELTEARGLGVQLVGDSGRDEVVLGCEVGVEGAVGQSGVVHEGGDPGAVDAVLFQPAAGGVQDPSPCRLLVVCAVPRHRILLAFGTNPITLWS